MDKSEKLKRYAQLETEVMQKFYKYIGEVVDKEIPTNVGALDVALKGNDVHTIIIINEQATMQRIETDNPHVFGYIVNEFYRDKYKVVSAFRLPGGYRPFTFPQEVYDRLTEIVDGDGNKEYRQLKKELYVSV